MSSKSLVYLFLTIGSLIGGYLPTLFGAGIFSYWSIFGSGIGSVIGIWLGIKLGNS